ncbi:MAG TPA: DUF488 family protein [Vulgatibacter sp.]|nr:DUF488 family protein [Vulgatibacter sp.]
MAASVRIKRVYEPPASHDGHRILVDRVWPRGKSKASAGIEAWMRDVAPSTPLRKWFGHDPARFDAFRSRYLEELRQEPARSAVESLAQLASREDVTLVYGAKDERHNQAVVLADEVRRLAQRLDADRRPRART